MNARLAERIARDVERTLPEPSCDATKYTLALLHQRAKRRPLTGFELAVRDLLVADLTATSEATLCELTLAACRALHDEIRGV